MVRPLGYEFDLERDAMYLVLGMQTRKGTPWLYAAPPSEDREVQIYPAVLFQFDWATIPPDWQIRMTREGEIELLPELLAATESWFERYVDGDPRVVEVIEREMKRSR